MSPTSNIFIEFEQSLKSNSNLKQFVTPILKELDINTLLELIGIEIEYRFRTGDSVDLKGYQNLIPDHQARQLDRVCADSIRNFVSTHCPVREALGALPAEFKSYKFLREIARGGAGVVYEAEDCRLNRRVAIKVLFRNCQTLSNEARIMSTMEHPSVCTIYDTGEINGLIYVVMQLINGPSLRNFCRTPPVLSKEKTVSVMIKSLDAVAQCHSRGIVHMDLKPANILFANQQPIIIDFGLARTTGLETNIRNVLGSPNYMAPELFARELYTPAILCDVFGMGVVLYELLTGKRPFSISEENPEHLYPPRRPSDYCNDIDADLERICLRAIAESPQQRYQTAADFRSDLQYWASGVYGTEASEINELDGESQPKVASTKIQPERTPGLFKLGWFQLLTTLLLTSILVFSVLNYFKP